MTTANVPIPLLEATPRRRRRHWKRLALLFPSLVIVTLFLVAAIFADLLTPYDPREIVLPDRLIPPVFDGGSWDHVLGTDQLGRDILARTMAGARISLTVVLIAVPAAAAVGTLVGLLSGWHLGWTDRVLMRFVDMQLAFPALLFAILVAAVWGPSLRNVILIITLWTWSGYARLVRADVLSLREREFVLAARAMGARDLRVLVRHVLPNLMNIVVILMTLEVATVILFEAGLSFLNVGVEAGSSSWGIMISEGRNFMTIAWWLIWIPGIAIVTIALTGMMMGDWVRDALDPQLRNVR